MRVTKRIDITVCDIGNTHMEGGIDEVKCGICNRDICLIHRVPASLENRPEWYPVFKHLCVECSAEPEIKDIIRHSYMIRGLTTFIHNRIVGDSMGQIQNKQVGD